MMPSASASTTTTTASVRAPRDIVNAPATGQCSTLALSTAARTSAPRRDGIGNGDGATGHIYVKQHDNATLAADHAFALILGLIDGRDDHARELDLVRRRREDLVGERDLNRMDERLAVKAEHPALSALLGVALHVAEVVVDPIEDREAMRARRRERRREPVEGRGALAIERRARL